MDKIIQMTLKSKLKAISGCDSMIWKIRAGYLAILSGTLGIMIGSNPSNFVNEFKAQFYIIFISIFGISFITFWIDYNYLKKKL